MVGDNERVPQPNKCSENVDCLLLLQLPRFWSGETTRDDEGPHYFTLLAIFVPSWTVFRHHLPEILRVDNRRDAFKRKVEPKSELGQSIPWLERVYVGTIDARRTWPTAITSSFPLALTNNSPPCKRPNKLRKAWPSVRRKSTSSTAVVLAPN